MFFDDFKNSARYSQFPHMQAIEKFVRSQDCTKIPDGEIEILGRDLFVRVMEYSTGPAEEKRFEAHRTYADLQFVVQGEEVMGYALVTSPEAATTYDEKADIQFFKNVRETASLLVPAGQFVVFFPGELHRPGCEVHARPGKVKKLVFKIKISG